MIRRALSVLLIAAYCALLGFIVYDARRQNSPLAPAGAAMPPVAAKPRPHGPAPFRIYYEKDPIPEPLLKNWAVSRRVKVMQSALKQDANGGWPKDGDLYVVSPRWLVSLQSQVPLNPVADKAVLRAVNPAFTSQSYDTGNELTVPWRWTPYVFYLRHDKDLPWEKNREVFYFREWVNDPRCLWPDDWDLLLAMELHYQNKSANHHPDNYAELISALKEKYAAVTAPEAACWQALLDGKIRFTFLPAAYREKSAAKPADANDEALKDIELQQPGLGNTPQTAAGTIVHLDLLTIGADSVARDKGESLVAYLLAAEQQDQLLALSGYFPVVSKIGHEFDSAPLPLPKNHWFNRSEILINRPPEPPAPPPVQPAVSGTESGTATPTTPPGNG
jgi:spermidine/putrescine-binding protein